MRPPPDDAMPGHWAPGVWAGRPSWMAPGCLAWDEHAGLVECERAECVRGETCAAADDWEASLAAALAPEDL